MIIISILIGIILAGFLLADYEFSEPMRVLGFVFLVAALVSIPFSHIDFKSQISGFVGVYESVDRARSSCVNIENAALQTKIAEANQWLASVKYYNETMLDIWVPDSVMELKPIE